jgi:ABC-2 type transport system permease protein
MRLALHAEWTKVRTLASPRWLLLGTIAVTVALSAAVTSVMTCGAGGCHDDTARLSLTGVELGQALVAILGVLVISGEFSSGMIRATLTAMPHRGRVLVAKAAVVSAIVAAAGTIAVLGSLLADGSTLRAAGGSVLYLILIALLSLGVATAVRDVAASIGVVLGLLFLFPVLAPVIGSPHWQRLLQQAGPMSAGLAIQATTDVRSLPIGPWAGLSVTAGWAVAALLAGGLLLRLRDA